MKFYKTLIVSLLLTSGNSFSNDSFLSLKINQQTKENLLPCAVAYIVPMMFKNENTFVIGTSVCASFLTYNYFKDDVSTEYVEKMRADVDSFLVNAKKDIESNNKTSENNYIYFQEIIRDTVSQKFYEIESGINDRIKQEARRGLKSTITREASRVVDEKLRTINSNPVEGSNEETKE